MGEPSEEVVRTVQSSVDRKEQKKRAGLRPQGTTTHPREDASEASVTPMGLMPIFIEVKI